MGRAADQIGTGGSPADGVTAVSSIVPAIPPMVPPFLTKCYDVVDDPSTDAVVSWSETKKSFVIWDPHAFSRDLLPKYFKHGNLTSFVRQLNTYGFRKVDPDRLEFANEGFLKGQKHLLKNLTRKKSSHQQQSHMKTSNLPCVEFGKFALENEIEILKREKDLLMQEIIKLGQQQQNSDLKLHNLSLSIQGMEQNQQQMMSFLAMVVQPPNLFVQLVQQSISRWLRTEANKKRRLSAPQDGVGGDSEVPSDRQIIKYQSFVTENMKPSLVAESNPNMPESLEPIPSKDDLCINVDATSLGADISLPSEGEESLADYLEHLLASPELEITEQIEPQRLADLMSDLEFCSSGL